MFDELWHNLLTWYTQHKRDLPWRRTRDPYAILVSETMLQQTGVERVIPKYAAFLGALPTLQSLAQASTGDIIRLWSGLGYNRRAVWLRRAAQTALMRWGGLPRSVEELQSLPGVGPYTARAVACFAFDVQVAVSDTNVRRVLLRLLRGPESIRLTESSAHALAASVLPPDRAYEWNQALMELGATVCTHKNPRCLICPVQSLCRAFPAIQTENRAQARIGEAKPRWKEPPFVGSQRYYRGRLVEILRQTPAGATLSLDTLGPMIKGDFSMADMLWLYELVRELVADGLARLDDEENVGLPY